MDKAIDWPERAVEHLAAGEHDIYSAKAELKGELILNFSCQDTKNPLNDW